MVLADAGNDAESRRARRHVARCLACRRRVNERRRALERLDILTTSDGTPVFSNDDIARRRLRARLQAVQQAPGDFQRRAARWAAAAALVCATATLGWLSADRPSNAPSEARTGAIVVRPLAAVTPGMALTTNAADVCGTRAPVSRPTLPAEVHLAIFDSYGADINRASEYELDYLITPALGGAPDARNLWPQSYRHTLWNAYVKDELELHLETLVCHGRLPLAEAQRELATDWIASYKRHFATDRPRRDYRVSPLGPGDEALLRAERDELESAPRVERRGGAMTLALLQGGRVF
jgi:hypothetical protein